MTQKLFAALVAGILLIGTSGMAMATIIPFSATLTGAQEVPPIASPASGTAFGAYDDATDTLSWNVEWSGLTAVPTASHFHLGDIGFNGPVVFITKV